MIPIGPLPTHKPQQEGKAATANAIIIRPPHNSVPHLLDCVSVGTSCALVHEMEVCSAEAASTRTLKSSQYNFSNPY